MFEKLTLKSVFLLGAFASVACGGVCGDKTVDADGNKDGVVELCDDGNTTPGDGCDGICGDIETGFECPTAGQACVIVNEGLACDDEIDNDGDGLVDCDDTANCGANDACQELRCTDGLDDNDNGLIDCADPQCATDPACTETGNAECSDLADNDDDGLIDCLDTDCVFADNCAVVGDGFFSPGVEQCDDGNIIDGDGCSATMTLEPLSDVIVPIANAELNNRDTETSVFSVVMPFILQLDLDNDNVNETNFLMVVTSDRPTICQDMFDPANSRDQATGSGIGPFNTIPAFGGKIPGTTVVSMIQTSDVPLGIGIFDGIGAPPLTKMVQTDGQAGPGEIFTEVGFIVLDANQNTLSDTTFASDGDGIINVTKFDITTKTFAGFNNAAGDPIDVPVGNVDIDFTNVNMIGQFLAAVLNQDLDGDGTDETKTINQPISGTIKAATCGGTMFF